jgi:multidrug efflux pump subunit AcrA (membrane-fusion protein)
MPGATSGSVLYVFSDGKLRGVPVKTGASDGQHTEIASGAVKAGEQVVTGFAAVTARRRNPFQMF